MVKKRKAGKVKGTVGCGDEIAQKASWTMFFFETHCAISVYTAFVFCNKDICQGSKGKYVGQGPRPT